MHNYEIDPYRIHSAQQVAELMDAKKKEERNRQEAIVRNRKIAEATIELKEQTKQQNEILKAQLSEVKIANDLLVHQATDSAKSARISQLIAIISVIVSVVVGISTILLNFLRDG